MPAVLFSDPLDLRSVPVHWNPGSLIEQVLHDLPPADLLSGRAC